MKTVLITGCSSGIGLASALALKERGHHVVASARNEEDVRVLQVTYSLKAVQLDLANKESVLTGFNEALMLTPSKSFDALVNNGWAGLFGLVEDLTREALEHQFQVFFGSHQLTNLCLPSMKQRGSGRIIQISSVLGFTPMPMKGAYVSSKFSLEGLNDCLRIELVNSGIYISSIQPGPVTTKFNENVLREIQRWIDFRNSSNPKAYEIMSNRLRANQDSPSRFAASCNDVAHLVVDAVEASRPRDRYRCTLPTHASAWMNRLMPKSLFNRVMSIGYRQVL